MPTILVVDDEPEILEFIVAALHHSGFNVLHATSGNRALELVEGSGQRVDLLLTDVVMPGLSGPMLVDRLLAANPSLPVLFMSGYDDRQVVKRYVLKEGFALLPKPFNVEGLMQRVQEMLPSAPAHS